MTVVYDGGQDGPRIHALIIGVGYYHHLEGGGDPKPEFFDWGGGQLTSTLASAKAFADWVLNEMDLPGVDLGNVRMLLSPNQQYQDPEQKITNPVPVDAANMANIRNVFRCWFQDCNQHEDNVCLFYFAGHGAGNYPLCLLPEDFGEWPEQPLTDTVNFDRTHEAMKTTCKAKTICFFADACRPLKFKVLASSSPGNILVDEDQSKVGAPNSPRFYATVGNANAYGRTNEVSFYTEALLMALRGLASHKKGGRWEVTTDRIHSGIREAMRHIKRDEGDPEQTTDSRGNPGNGLLTVLDNPPKLPVEIELAPELAYQATPNLSILHGAGHNKLDERDGVSSPWHTLLPAGSYMGEAEFPNHEYPKSAHQTPVTPATLYHQWDVENPDG